MYVPRPDRADEQRARQAVAGAGIGTVFSANGTLNATTLPLLWEGDMVIAHLARANPHWRQLDGAEVLIAVTGPNAYISPSWYPSKADHGRAVPTWNYTEVQLRGSAQVLDGADDVRRIVEALTDRHETGRPERWLVSDAPSAYIEQQLHAIVGLQVLVSDVQAKQKWSGSRSGADAAAVLHTLDADDPAAAAEMRRART